MKIRLNNFILDKKGRHYFLEINSLPGMTSASLLPMAAKNAGLEFNELIKCFNFLSK